MQLERRDNRTRMQRKAYRHNTIATLCLFACAVVAFCAVACKIHYCKIKIAGRCLKTRNRGTVNFTKIKRMLPRLTE